ncbi:MAG: PAS domain-containing protein [Proteobacteria bacterium]|nr:PAS domain-containing protein [Pseudomonadota bacterium]
MKYIVKDDIIRTVFDAMPSLIFVVDDSVKIQEYNASAIDLLKVQRSTILKKTQDLLFQ